MSKRIIIPKGLVNPGETTIIEIPAELSEERELVASPPRCENAQPECPGAPVQQPQAASAVSPCDTCPGRFVSPTRSANFGRTQTIQPNASQNLQNSSSRPITNITRAIYRTYIRESNHPDSESSMQQGSFGTIASNCPDNCVPPDKTANINRTRTTHPNASQSFNIPLVTSTPKSPGNLTRRIQESLSTLYDSSLFETYDSSDVSSNVGRTHVRCPSFAIPQATSTPKRGDLTRTIRYSYSTLYDSSDLNRDSSIQPCSFGTFECTAPDSYESTDKSSSFGRTHVRHPSFPIPQATSSPKRGGGNLTRTIPDPYSTLYDSSDLNYGATNSSCPESCDESSNFGRTHVRHPSFPIPQATSTPKRGGDNLTRTIPDPYSTLYDSSDFNYGTTNSGCPESCDESSNFGRTHVRHPSFPIPQATSTPKRENNLTRVIRQSFSTLYDSSEIGAGSESYDGTSNFGRTHVRQPSCPIPRATPKQAGNLTRTIRRSFSTLYASDYPDSGSPIHSESFGTADSSCPARCESVRSGNLGRTQNARPHTTRSFHIPPATSAPQPAGNTTRTVSRTGGTMHSNATHRLATSTPKPVGNLTRTIQQTYSFLRDSNYSGSGSSIQPGSFGTIESSCPDSCGSTAQAPSSGRTRTIPPPSSSSFNIPEATSTPRRSRSFSQHPTRVVKKVSKTYMKTSHQRGASPSSSGLPSGNFENTGYSDMGRIRSKSESRSSDGAPRSPALGILGNAYLNSTIPNANFAPHSPVLMQSCPGSSQARSNYAVTPKVVKKINRTVTELPPACDGSRTRTIHEISTVEHGSPSQEEELNSSAVSNMQTKLQDIEDSERSQLQEDLKVYQDARRALMTNTTFRFGERSINVPSPSGKMQCKGPCNVTK